MKAAMCHQFGPLSDVRIEDIASPALQPGTVRVRVAVAAANPPDALMPQGKYQVRPTLPFAIGLEGAGVVAEVSEEVRDLKIGDRVMIYAGHGCFAEEVVVPAHLAYKMPDRMPFEIGAGFALVHGTAYHALVDRGQLSAGETVAVLGAAGGIGLCAIQIAKALGARVIALASTPAKREICRQHGADEALDSGLADIRDRLRELSGGAGIDVVHDTVGGALTLNALRALRRFGRHLIVGYSSGEIPQIPANQILLKQISVIGVSFRQCAQNTSDVARAGISALVSMWEEGKLTPYCSRVHAFDRFEDAVNALSSRSAIGKHLIRISDL